MARGALNGIETKAIGVRMPLDLVDRIDAAAAGSGLDRPEWIRYVLTQRLDQDLPLPPTISQATRFIPPPCPPHPADKVVGSICMLCGGTVRVTL